MLGCVFFLFSFSSFSSQNLFFLLKVFKLYCTNFIDIEDLKFRFNEKWAIPTHNHSLSTLLISTVRIVSFHVPFCNFCLLVELRLHFVVV